MSEDEFFQERSLARSKAERLAKGLPKATRRIAPTGPAEAPPAKPAPPAPPRQLSAEAEGKMVDITDKPVVAREAIAEGFVRLQPATLRALADGTAPKGDPFPAARLAGILAAKKTPEIIPLCHPLPLTAIEVDLILEERGVRARARVKTTAQTGVEMEALTAVSAALLTVWDMTKALEKDETGNYPDTAIEAIRVLRKTKGAPE